MKPPSASRVPRVALVSCSRLPALSPDDHPLRDALVRRGASVEPAIWDDPAVAWEAYDAVVIRSTWDYHRRVGEFRAWLDRCERAAVRLWNPAGLVRGNIHKSYLLRLADDGVRVVPTVLLDDSAATGAVMRERGWLRAVVKPATSATAFQTHIVTQSDLASLASRRDVLVQPFMEEIVREGEWSFVFIAGTFSHAVLKRPREGDFRVQSDWGGTSALATPSGALIEQAAATLEAVREPWLYARVDGVVRDGILLLMELEMTEPTLFLSMWEPAAERLAAAILDRCE